MTTVDAVVAALAPWLADAEGITVSGGEPFDQPEALAHLLRELRARTEVDILVFSGHAFAKLRGWLERSPGLIDAIMSEPYDERAPQTQALRGSDNQRLHQLTDLGRARLAAYDRPLSPADRRFDAMFDADGGVWFAGIPARDDFRRLRAVLEAAGHQVTLSQAPSTEPPS
jgi:anaerobic ribonucleoside-triphosphate reductase activating protein